MKRFDLTGNHQEKYNELQAELAQLRAAEPLDVDAISTACSSIITELRLLANYAEAQEFTNEMIQFANTHRLPILKASLWRNLGLVYWMQCDFTSAIEIATRALELSKSIDDALGVAQAKKITGVFNQNIGQHTAAIQFLSEARDDFKALERRIDEATCLYWIGVCHSNLLNFEEALEFLLSSLQIFKEEDVRTALGDTYNSLGVLFFSMRMPARAREFLELALEIRREIGEPRSLADVLNNLGMIYRSNGELEVALDYYNQALAIHESLGSMQKASNIMNNTASLLEQQGKYEAALILHQKTLEIRRKQNYLDGIYSSIGQIAAIYFQLGEFEQGWQIAGEVWAKIAEIPRVHAYQYYGLRSQYLEARGDAQGALEMFRQSERMRRDIYDESRILRINDILNQFISREKQHEAEALRKKNLALEESYAQLQKAQAEIIHLEKHNSALAMAVTANHELNQPLMIASANFEMLANELRDMALNDSARRYMRRIWESLERISSILEDYRENRTPENVTYVDGIAMWKFAHGDSEKHSD